MDPIIEEGGTEAEESSSEKITPQIVSNKNIDFEGCGQPFFDLTHLINSIPNNHYPEKWLKDSFWDSLPCFLPQNNGV